jgi:hypothetical protein
MLQPISLYGWISWNLLRSPPLNHIYSYSLCVAGNICITLEMAPGVNPTPRNRKLAEFRTLLRSPPLNYKNLCSLRYKQYLQYIRYGLTPGTTAPQKWEIGWRSWNLLRSPPLNHIYSCSLCYKQYMQYIRYGPLGHPPPPPLEMGNWLNLSKAVEMPTPKPYSLVPYVKVLGTSDGMQIMVICSSVGPNWLNKYCILYRVFSHFL